MRIFLFLCLIWAMPASAAPKLAATIAPLAGLVADLTEGITKPATLLPATADPHHFSLRPSQIGELRTADIVFAVGNDMEPWLGRIEASLGAGLTVVKLGEIASEGLPARDFDLSPRPEIDPHMWLDPGEAIPWVLEITQHLIKVDAANTAAYRANEFVLLSEIVAAKERLEEIGVRLEAADIRFVVAHDAYQYLEQRLGVAMVGMLSDQTDTNAGARSLSKISRLEGPICLIETPEHRVPDEILPNAPRVIIDPIGAEFVGTARFSARFYMNMATALESCFEQP